jgi:hypothetical protein
MTTTHTQGRLHAPGLAEIHDDKNRVVAACSDTDPVNESERPSPSIAEGQANARRLAACWNACIDIPTEALMQVEDCDTPVFQLLTQTWEERDAMKALLHRVTQDSEWSCMDPDLQDDIAKALGMDKTPALPVPPPPPDIFTAYCEPMCAKDDQQPQPGGGPGYICRKCGFDMPF